MFCPNCGKKLIEDARFCDNCGREISQQQIDAVNAMRAQQAQNETQPEAAEEKPAAAQTPEVAAPYPSKEEFFVPPPQPKPAGRVCPYCKSAVKNTDVYCPVCKSFMAATQYPPVQTPKKKNVVALVGLSFRSSRCLSPKRCFG